MNARGLGLIGSDSDERAWRAAGRPALAAWRDSERRQLLQLLDVRRSTLQAVAASAMSARRQWAPSPCCGCGGSCDVLEPCPLACNCPCRLLGSSGLSEPQPGGVLESLLDAADWRTRSA